MLTSEQRLALIKFVKYAIKRAEMSRHYDEAITDPNIIRRVIRNYARSMFGVELSESEIDELLEEMGMMLYRH